MSRSDVLIIQKTTVKRFVIFILTLALIGGAGYATWLYQQEKQRNQQAQSDIERLSNPAESAKIAEEQIISNIKKLTNVPEDEEPTILNVADAEQLKGQIFFDNLQNEDKIITYQNARRFITYRPSTNQIITSVVIPSGEELPVEPTETPEE